MFINREDESFVGLFSQAYNGTIENLGLEYVNIAGFTYVGGIVGKSSSSIINSYSTGNIHGYDSVGGLVGHSISSLMINSHSSADIKGSNNVGGLIGVSSSSLTIKKLFLI